MIKKMWILLAAASMTCVFSTYAMAIPFQIGDVFAGVDGGGNIQVWRSGSIVTTLNTGSGTFTTGMAFDASGNVYATDFNNNVSKFDNNGTLVSSSFINAGSNNESILFDKAQNIYVGDAGSNLIRKFDSSGSLITSFPVSTEARGTDWIDLAADQKTIYYTSEGGRIMRYDTSTNTQLADFANVGGASFALRILGDGGVLVANSSNIKRLNSAGTVVQNYDVAGQDSWFALNLDPDGKSFWSGDYSNDKFYQFDIATGSVIGSAYDTGLGGNHLFGLAVYGELTQSGGGVKVPEPATAEFLGIGLAGLALIRRKLAKG